LADWPACLSALSEAYLQREARWRVVVDARVEGFLRAMLRFGRPDGSLVFEPGPPPQDRAQQLRFWAERLSDPALAAVLDIWSPSTAQNRRRRSAPPLPADARPDRPLAILRADWSPQGDLLAIDQRDRDQPCLLELVGLGRQWLGPRWLSGSDFEPTSPPRPTVWRTGPYADLAEWTFRTGGSRVSRSALLLRGRQLALIAEQVDGGDGDASWRVELPPDVTPINLPGTRALMLSAARGGTSRVLPIGLPTLSYPTERGSLVAEGQQLILRQHREGRRCWMPLLISWRPERDRKPTQWRILTVTERSRICRPDEAFAVRVAWGARESLVIYRSLARPTRRAFLGHQTETRMLVGLFSKEGIVEPLLSVEDE
jgi:hypothetical protein